MGIFDFIEPFISPVLGLAGDIFGSSQQSKSNRSAINENVRFQREFAQHGIRWKVDDAKAAGISPLAALGVNPIQFSPISVQSDTPNWGQHGQNIGRAITAKFSKVERAAVAQELALQNEDLKKKGLENAILAEELRRIRQVPAMPDEHGVLAGQGDIQEYNLPPDVEYHKSQVPYSSGPGTQAGAVPLYQFGWVGPDEITILPSTPMEEKLDADPFTKFESVMRRGGRYLRRQLDYLRSSEGRKKEVGLIRQEIVGAPFPGKGKKWVYDQRSGTYRRVRIDHGGFDNVYYYKSWR